MKANEMTNEELANKLIYTTGRDPICQCNRCVLTREAAARLRKQGEIIKMAHVETRIAAELRRRLKVAEDALVKLQDRIVSSVYDGTIDPHEALEITENALAAIREEGGES